MSEIMQNPKVLALKKFMATVLGQKYSDHEELIHRATFYLVTDKDMASFGKMVNDLYEIGYMKAVNDYKDQLQKLGIKINISQKNLVDNPK